MVVANAELVPCGHPLPPRGISPDVAVDLSQVFKGRRAGISQERARSCHGPGALVQALEEERVMVGTPGGGRSCARRRVPVAAMAQAEGGWCLCIYLRTEV